MMMMLVGWVMKLAPLGIFALLAKLMATEDISVLSRLAEFAAVVTGTTIFHGAVVLPLLLWIFGRMSPWTFFKGTRTALITAFATSSSSATMPLSMKCAQENLGVRPQTAGFVIPLGTQLNMDGTALYEAAAALCGKSSWTRLKPDTTNCSVPNRNDRITWSTRNSKCGYGYHDYGITVCGFTCRSNCDFTSNRSFTRYGKNGCKCAR